MSNFQFPESWNTDPESETPESISYGINPTLLGKPTLRRDKWWSYMLDRWTPPASVPQAPLPDLASTNPGGGQRPPTADPGSSAVAADNQRQNKMVRDIAVGLQLSKDQAQALHREITGQGLSYQEILERAKEMFGK